MRSLLIGLAIASVTQLACAATSSAPVSAQLISNPAADLPWVAADELRKPQRWRHVAYRSALHGGKPIGFAYSRDPACTEQSPCPVVFYNHGHGGNYLKAANVPLERLRAIGERIGMRAVWIAGNGLYSEDLDLPYPGIDSWDDKNAACSQKATPEYCLRPTAALLDELIPLVRDLPFVDSDIGRWQIHGHSRGGRSMWEVFLLSKYQREDLRFGAIIAWAGGLSEHYLDRRHVRRLLAQKETLPALLSIWGTADCASRTCHPDDPKNHYSGEQRRGAKGRFRPSNKELMKRLREHGIDFTEVILENYNHAILPMIDAVGEEALRFGETGEFRLLDPIPKKSLPAGLVSSTEPARRGTRARTERP